MADQSVSSTMSALHPEADRKAENSLLARQQVAKTRARLALAHSSAPHFGHRDTLRLLAGQASLNGVLRMRTSLVLAASLFVVLSSSSSDARPFRSLSSAVECNVTMPCDFSSGQTRRIVRSAHVAEQPRLEQRTSRYREAMAMAEGGSSRGQVVGGRPPGCPSSFCGCGASLRVFGRIVPGLNLASNWLKFPRTAPGPGMVAARHGHVFVLESHVSGDTWLAYDANSGGHATRIHARSLRGYTVVNPRA
jgi:hypothetical protein